ncbi:MAG: acetoin dehydrogenase dihydrolipoyllysine-residue acetyltransferase subunit [Janthinobacterium lividum]
MIVELTLPRLGETMETGRVAGWLKRPGESFRRGETLVEIESDKTVVEMPALANGVLTEIVVEAGQDADVGAVLCRYEDGREVAASVQPDPALPDSILADPVSIDPVLPEPVASTPAVAGPIPAAPAPASGDARSAPTGIRATPLARAVARQGGIKLAGLTGTGRRGRIEAADVHASPAAAPATMRQARVPAGLVACRDWGAGTAHGARLVLLHGLAGDVQSWAQLAAALTRTGRHVTAIDLPGHGGTGIEASDLNTVVSVVTAFLDTLDGEPVELVGHSLGGAVAARVARSTPSRVRRLTLLAPAGLDRAIDIDFVRGIVRARTGGGLQHLLRRLVVRPATLTTAQLDALAAELARGRLLGLADALVDAGGQQVDITRDLQALAMPVRVVWGMQDRIIPWTQASQAGSRTAIHLIQDAGHVPHWDQPGEVAALFD